MNPTGVDTPGMRRLKVLSTLAIGASIPLLNSALQEFFFPGPRRPDAVAWVARVLPATLALTIIFVMVLAYRIARYSALPRVPTIAAMVLLIWIMAFLGHIY